VTLYHARLQAGAWVGDVVQPGTWGPPLDLYAAEPSLAFDALERPVIAGHFLRRVETGSIDSSELRVFLGGAATFCNEAAVTANDGYVGGDGTKYTGADPAVALDRAGRVHVLFLDQAKWHDGQGYENEIRGQLRYAVNGGGAWSVSRLVSQPGQSASPNPLIGYRAPQFVLSADGTRIVVVAVETSWATNSIYNPQAVPATYRAQVIYGTIGP
jgi:hypothetical protein